VVIAKEIRDRLGIEPGVETFQRVVADHVEIYFEHSRSLAGSLAPFVKRSISPEEWAAAKEEAWAQGVAESEAAWRADYEENKRQSQ
jgi:hypothetical protein